MMVPPTVVVTAWFFPMPKRIAIGYARSVCEANMLAIRMAVGRS